MKKLLLLFYCICWNTTVNAQQLVQERLYKLGNTTRGLVSSTVTHQGNVCLAGSFTNPPNPGYQSIFTLINPSGDTLWMRNGPMIALGGISIKQSPEKGFTFYTTRVTTSPIASGVTLLKYNSNGQIKSTMAYGTNTFDAGYKLLSAPDSGYFLGGRNIINGKNKSFALSRTDSLGNLKWRKGFNWGGSDFLADMQHTINGNIVMYGITGAPQRLKLLLVNQNGDSIIGRQLNITGNSNRTERILSSVCEVLSLSDSGFLMAAEIDTSIAGAVPFLGMVVKVNANLQPVWHYINRSVPNNVSFIRSRELTDGTVVVLGFERKGAGSTPGDKFFLYRFSTTGLLLNVYTFTSILATQIYTTTLEALPDSSFIIGGSGVITSGQNLSTGFYVAKVKVAGLAPALPLPSPIIATGIKADVTTGKISLGQSFPNPAESEIYIPYHLPKNYRSASIQIREIATGRELRKYALKSGESSLKVDLSHIPNGLYLYSLIVDEKPLATKKLAVMK